LHALNKFNFPQGINIFGPPGLKRYIKTIISQPFTMPLRDLRTKVKLIELNTAQSLPINMTFFKLEHSSLCYGYRLTIHDKVLAYLSDTGLCVNLFKLAPKADILIAESSLGPGEISKWPHLNPESAAIVAKKTRVKKLILVHFDSSIYDTLSKRRIAGISARKIFKNTLVAYDDMEVDF
jgi:ribonuclease BN (tRNA processing enzyme)